MHTALREMKYRFVWLLGGLPPARDVGAVRAVIWRVVSPIEVDSDKMVRMWYTALRKEGALPGRCRMSEW